VPARNLCPRPPVTDAFGKTGRRWLGQLELPSTPQRYLICRRQLQYFYEARSRVFATTGRRLKRGRSSNCAVAVQAVAHGAGDSPAQLAGSIEVLGAAA
jgi:hypothetical protein